MKAMTPSAALAAVIGATPMPRTEVTKKVWEYIKKNGLQDKIKRTMINADAKLKAVVGCQPDQHVWHDQGNQQAPQVNC